MRQKLRFVLLWVELVQYEFNIEYLVDKLMVNIYSTCLIFFLSEFT